MSLQDCVIAPQDNIYLSKCNDIPSVLSGFFETPSGFTIPIATAVDPVALKAFLQAAMKAPIATRIYWWPDLDNFTDQSEATTYQTSVLSERETNPGRYKFMFGITQSLCTHKAMYSHKKRTGGALLLDLNGKMLASFNSAGDITCLELSMLNPEKLKFSDGSVATESPIVLSLRRHTQIDETGVMIDVSSFLNELIRLADVVLTNTIAQATTILSITVKQKCDGTPIIGLILTDFVVKSTAGATQTATSFLDNGDGTYTLTKSTNWIDGSITLKPASTLSLTAYEANTLVVDV